MVGAVQREEKGDHDGGGGEQRMTANRSQYHRRKMSGIPMIGEHGMRGIRSRISGIILVQSDMTGIHGMDGIRGMSGMSVMSGMSAVSLRRGTTNIVQRRPYGEVEEEEALRRRREVVALREAKILEDREDADVALKEEVESDLI